MTRSKRFWKKQIKFWNSMKKSIENSVKAFDHLFSFQTYYESDSMIKRIDNVIKKMKMNITE